MGVDIKGLYNVIHYGPLSDLEFYMQEMGRGKAEVVNTPRHFHFFYERQLRQFKPEMLDYVKSNSCRKRKLVAFLEEKDQGILSVFPVMFVLLYVNVRKTSHKTMEMCFQAKISVSSGGDDISKVRNVYEDERPTLRVLLKECQEKMRLEILKSNHHCFSNSIVDDTVCKCEFLFAVLMTLLKKFQF